VSGEVDTGFIERHREALFAQAYAIDDRTLAIATLARIVEWREAGEAAALSSGDPWSPWNRQDAFRLLEEGHDEVRWREGNGNVAVAVHRRRDGGVRLGLPGGPVDAHVRRNEDGRLAIRFGDETFVATVVRRQTADGADYTLFVDGATRRLHLVDPLDVTQYETAGSADASVRSPLPGRIIDLKVKAGDRVSKGAALLVLEAMKMEHTLSAPADGTVKSVRYGVGEQVAEGAELVEFDPG
jgi:3-methylcrotonyl-CoA carboxylase alpha subunit